MFEEAIFNKIINAWGKDQSHPHRDRKQKPLPDIKDIRVLVETALWASLKREEDRSITFSIVLLSKDKVAEEERTSGRKQIILPFDVSRPFSVELLTKIAPAFDYRTTSLIVAPIDDKKTEYEIWGVMFFDATTPTTSRFDEIPVGILGLNFPRPDIIMVTAVSPGSLLISRGDSQIGRFILGNFMEAIPNPFYSRAMGSYIKNQIKNNDLFKEFQSDYWVLYRETLDLLLAEASSRSHGGAIILIPDEKVRNYSEFFVSKYSFSKSLSLEPLLKKLLLALRSHDVFDILGDVALDRKISKRINLFAQLSCIDGALIISNRFQLISFGSTLGASKWKGNVFTGPDGFGGGGGNFDTSKLGTRHNATINFVGACADSIAFVVSQDGPIRGFVRKDKETILCWPDCRVSMFV
ncbi:MAG: diadenylate cyclase [bacterium]|nr:diadenylate cyclase [bacterium]